MSSRNFRNRKRTSPKVKADDPRVDRGEEAGERRSPKSSSVEEREQDDQDGRRREGGVRGAGAFERTGSQVADRKPKRARRSRAVAEKGAAHPAGSRPSPGHSVRIPQAIELAPPAAAPYPARDQGPKGWSAEEAPSAVKALKGAGQRQGFKLNEFVVYPAHGVGQIVAIEEQEVAGFKLELFVINFSKDKLTLRVPTSKVSGVGMRKISDPDTARRSLEILTGRARVKRTMWSRRAQEYETKINSGDINAIAEVVRDLYRSEAQPEQSYSERQLYEAALDRMVREIAAVQKSNEIDALKAVEAQLQKGQSRAFEGPSGPPSRGRRDRTGRLRASASWSFQGFDASRVRNP